MNAVYEHLTRETTASDRATGRGWHPIGGVIAQKDTWNPTGFLKRNGLTEEDLGLPLPNQRRSLIRIMEGGAFLAYVDRTWALIETDTWNALSPEQRSSLHRQVFPFMWAEGYLEPSLQSDGEEPRYALFNEDGLNIMDNMSKSNTRLDAELLDLVSDVLLNQAIGSEIADRNGD
jgi:hypothetical protein